MANTDISSLVAATTRAASLANLVLVTPQTNYGYQPQVSNSDVIPVQQPALLFHYEGEQSATIEADITDHFVEDNTAIQDQIALKPETVQTQGFIGELNNVPPFGLSILKTIAEKLTVLVAYTPELTASAQLAYDQAFALYQAGASLVNSAVSAWASITGLDTSTIGDDGLSVGLNQNKQQTMFQQLYGYMQERRLFTVQTPWAVFQNMAILRLHPIQDPDTRMLSTFELTFKRIRTASTLTDLPVSLGRAVSQASKLQDNGVSAPKADISLADGITEVLRSLGA